MKQTTSLAIRFPDELSPEPEAVRKQIDQAVDSILSNYTKVLRSYVQLGYLALLVRQKKYWETWGYSNFNEFVSDIGDRIRKGRTQIYNAISVVERLSPFVESTQLESMGITNATALARAVRITGKKPSPEIVEAGVEMEFSDYRSKIADEFRITEDRPANSKWREVGGFWATEEEWKEFLYAISIARRTDPVVAKETPNWAVLKECLQRFVAEYLATYAAAVEEGKG